MLLDSWPKKFLNTNILLVNTGKVLFFLLQGVSLDMTKFEACCLFIAFWRPRIKRGRIWCWAAEFQEYLQNPSRPFRLSRLMLWPQTNLGLVCTHLPCLNQSAPNWVFPVRGYFSNLYSDIRTCAKFSWALIFKCSAPNIFITDFRHLIIIKTQHIIAHFTVFCI